MGVGGRELGLWNLVLGTLYYKKRGSAHTRVALQYVYLYYLRYFMKHAKKG